MNDKELAGALLVRLVNNDMLTGVITELCTRLQRDAPRLFAYKIKYLCNLLREKARTYDRNVWIKFAVEHQEEYIYKYLDDLTEYLSTYAESVEKCRGIRLQNCGCAFCEHFGLVTNRRHNVQRGYSFKQKHDNCTRCNACT